MTIGSGFGSYVLESEPFGFFPADASQPRGETSPVAPMYDGPKHDFATDENGRVVSIHYVDSGVQMAMFDQKGDLPNAPEVGNELLQSKDIGTDRQHAEVERLVRDSYPISRYLADGDIDFLQVTDEYTQSTGALLVSFYYKNNHTGKDGIATNKVTR